VKGCGARTPRGRRAGGGLRRGRPWRRHLGWPPGRAGRPCGRGRGRRARTRSRPCAATGALSAVLETPILLLAVSASAAARCRGSSSFVPPATDPGGGAGRSARPCKDPASTLLSSPIEVSTDWRGGGGGGCLAAAGRPFVSSSSRSLSRSTCRGVNMSRRRWRGRGRVVEVSFASRILFVLATRFVPPWLGRSGRWDPQGWPHRAPGPYLRRSACELVNEACGRVPIYCRARPCVAYVRRLMNSIRIAR
jgi:hypothetical protein